MPVSRNWRAACGGKSGVIAAAKDSLGPTPLTAQLSPDMSDLDLTDKAVVARMLAGDEAAAKP